MKTWQSPFGPLGGDIRKSCQTHFRNFAKEEKGKMLQTQKLEFPFKLDTEDTTEYRRNDQKVE